jgi:type I restriction enzyme S subunit
VTDVNQLITDRLDIWTTATEKKSSAGRGNGGAVSLYGIKKLRELILELAVQGKLVAQISKGDEGRDLIAKIKRTQAELYKAKVIKKPKVLPDPDSGELGYVLPLGWAICRLNDIGDWGAGATPSRKSSGLYGGRIPWFKSGELIADTIDTSEETVTEEALKKSSLRLNKPGDVLVAMYGATIGKTAILGVEATTNQAVCACTPFQGVNNRYLLLLLKAYKGRLTSMGAGGAQPNISREKIIATVVALPPTEEQHRIVDKVDELMGLCDALERQAEDSLKAHQTLVETCLATLTNSQSPEDLTQNWTRIEAHFDTLFTTEESVEALRRAALDLALRGLLTYRKEGDAPASELLGKLYAKNKKSASSRHRTIVSKIKEAEPRFDLPESWAWSNLGLLSSDLRYGTSKKCDRDDSLVPVLRIPNVSGGRVELDDMKFGPLDSKEVADLRLRSNDLLIIRSNGSLDIVGSFAVVPELKGDFAFAGYLVRVRIDPAYVDPRYIWYVSRSRFLRDQIEGPIRHGVGLKNVNSTELASLQFPIPPREEQERILDKLDDLFELCDRLSQRVDDSNTINLALADTLTSKIH